MTEAVTYEGCQVLSRCLVHGPSSSATFRSPVASMVRAGAHHVVLTLACRAGRCALVVLHVAEELKVIHETAMEAKRLFVSCARPQGMALEVLLHHPVADQVELLAARLDLRDHQLPLNRSRGS